LVNGGRQHKRLQSNVTVNPNLRRWLLCLSRLILINGGPLVRSRPAGEVCRAARAPLFDIGGWVYGMLSVPPGVAVYLGGGGAVVAFAAGASAADGAESPHKHTFMWLERPCHS
jgi:hypothetical protein